MIDLLIAILIALGFRLNGRTEGEIKKEDPAAYDRATTIINTGGYKYSDTGVVIIESGGD